MLVVYGEQVRERAAAERPGARSSSYFGRCLSSRRKPDSEREERQRLRRGASRDLCEQILLKHASNAKLITAGTLVTHDKWSNILSTTSKAELCTAGRQAAEVRALTRQHLIADCRHFPSSREWLTK